MSPYPKVSAAFVSALFAIIGVALAQRSFECPEGWVRSRQFCYRFEPNSRVTYDQARVECDVHGAGVVSVESRDENSFIVRWLQMNDPFQREWFTSGVRDVTSRGDNGTDFIWGSTGKAIEGSLFHLWIHQPDPRLISGVIVYAYGQTGIGWKLADPSVGRPYICKIALSEAYRILLTNRGYDYGTEPTEFRLIKKGPHFIVQPQSLVVVNRDPKELDERSTIEPIKLECVVDAYPAATYQWYMGDNYEIELTKERDSRYTLTNGKLIIDQPNVEKDSGSYRCVAENEFGRVYSNFVEVSFGQLGEFNNVPDAGTRAKAYEGATVECSRIVYKPAITYQWFKGSSYQVVRPQFQDYMFISNNGKLYFSEVTVNDEDDYTCVATLTGVNRYTISTTQPPMKISLPIPLTVQAQAPKADWGPEIQDDFIAVYPSPPMRGNDVRLECFAYGSSTSKFVYSWNREDKPMPASAILLDHNRVLIIKDAQMEDSGRYRCTVSRGSQASDTRVVQLTLGARPYFVSELQDQHADINSQLTWICHARGNPTPAYTWYKNGAKLVTDAQTGITVQKNVLTINKLEEKHRGMYQCAAVNSYGISLSTAQLRVLAFAPTLSRHPPPPTLLASIGTNLTIRCMPEGAPTPIVEWSKGGSVLYSDGTKITIYDNGNIHIKNLQNSDVGTYTCKASNTYGDVQASTVLDITDRVGIIIPPADETTSVNKTAFLTCQASRPQNLDMIYEWTFNGFPIDFTEPNFRQTQGATAQSSGLYILNPGFKHEGLYTCSARTTFTSESATAYLTVYGPPKQAAGIYHVPGSTTTNSTTLVWTAGSDSGSPILRYIVQNANEFDPETWEDLITVSSADSALHNDINHGRHEAVIIGLHPGTGYRFRIAGVNAYGRGIPSAPSQYIQTLSAPPTVAPRQLRGGGGSVGDLTIRWDPLPRAEWGASSLSYRVYWRKHEENRNSMAKWGLIEIESPYTDNAVETVGAENYYLLYDVKIQALNPDGFGPNSTVTQVYSAESLPIAVPENVNTDTFNSTAIAVYWDPVPDNRDYARGKIKGYQINYWNEEDDPDVYMQSIRYYGQLDNGLIIGLEVDVNMVVDVQVYNSAGLGPRSNQYIMETSGFAPLLYPQEVRITSAGRFQAHIWWRGVSITTDEEALVGYAIWLWAANEDFRAARIIEVPGRTFETTLTDLQENTLYAMRVAAVGDGGYGKKTPTMYFTYEGQILIDYSLARTIDVFKSTSDTLHISAALALVCTFLQLAIRHIIAH